jgi:hypothetical protein
MNLIKGLILLRARSSVASGEYKLNEEMAELCGIVSGDGNIWTNSRKYEISITGSPKDKEYMDKVVRIITHSVKPKVYYRMRGRGLRVSIYSKSYFEFLTKEVGFGVGIEKNSHGVPIKILKSDILNVGFVRGLFDTDGSVFTSKKRGVEEYPTIEITNDSLILMEHVRGILEENGLRTTFRKSNCNTFKIAVHGNRMTRKWLQVIGSTHPRKRGKMESIIKSID